MPSSRARLSPAAISTISHRLILGHVLGHVLGHAGCCWLQSCRARAQGGGHSALNKDRAASVASGESAAAPASLRRGSLRKPVLAPRRELLLLSGWLGALPEALRQPAPWKGGSAVRRLHSSIASS